MKCPYAFDFIEKDWKKILFLRGFNDFREHLFYTSRAFLLTIEMMQVSATSYNTGYMARSTRPNFGYTETSYSPKPLSVIQINERE